MFENDRCCGEQATANMNATANFDSTMGMNMEFNSYMGGMPNSCCQMPTCQPMMCPPIYECPQQRICHRTINYEVPQV